MQFRNPTFTASGAIDCEIKHPTYGWIPFTASETDVEEHGRAIFASAKESAAPYVPPAGPTDDQLADAARVKRNALLKASDWTQVADAPVDKEAWASYRQALRDIPMQEGFPSYIVWPGEP